MNSDNKFYYWYPKDILTSLRVNMMSLEEEGAYRRALDYCWLNGKLPSSINAIQKLIGKSCTEEIAKVVISMFEERDGFLFHKKQLEQLDSDGKIIELVKRPLNGYDNYPKIESKYLYNTIDKCRQIREEICELFFIDKEKNKDAYKIVTIFLNSLYEDKKKQDSLEYFHKQFIAYKEITEPKFVVNIYKYLGYDTNKRTFTLSGIWNQFNWEGKLKAQKYSAETNVYNGKFFQKN